MWKHSKQARSIYFYNIRDQSYIHRAGVLFTPGKKREDQSLVEVCFPKNTLKDILDARGRNSYGKVPHRKRIRFPNSHSTSELNSTTEMLVHHSNHPFIAQFCFWNICCTNYEENQIIQNVQWYMWRDSDSSVQNDWTEEAFYYFSLCSWWHSVRKTLPSSRVWSYFSLLKENCPVPLESEQQ